MKSPIEIDSSDDEADLARWEKTLDLHRHEADAPAPDVKTERDSKDKKDRNFVHSSRDSNENIEMDMNNVKLAY